MAFYCAEQRSGHWTHVYRYSGPRTDEVIWTAFPRSPAGLGYDPRPWFAVSEFRLAEIDHRKQIKTLARRKKQAAKREFKRMHQLPYRRALQSLAGRGLTEADYADGVEIGGYSESHVVLWPLGVWLGRLTEQGSAWVEQNALEQVEPLTDAMFAAHWDFPEVERWPRKVEPSPISEVMNFPASQAVSSVDPRQNDELSKSSVVDLLTAEGFAAEQVLAILRAWHREERLNHRALYGSTDEHPPLAQCTFTTADVVNFRIHLTGPESPGRL